MNIFFVTNAYGAGGAEEHLLDLFDGFSANGANPVFLVREEGIFEGKVRRCFPFRESLCSLTPVVAYNVGGYVEMLGKGGGSLVDVGRDAFAEAVAGLLHDLERRRRPALQGRKVVEDGNALERMGRERLEFYRSLVAG